MYLKVCWKRQKFWWMDWDVMAETSNKQKINLKSFICSDSMPRGLEDD